jgi:hypothetical protein
MMYSIKPKALVAACLLTFAAQASQAAQTITLTPTAIWAAPGETITIAPSYGVTAPNDNTETGLGLCLHYDASQFTAAPHLTNILSTGLVGAASDNPNGLPCGSAGGTIIPASTTRQTVTGWADPAGAWTGGVLPVKLYDGAFTLSSGFNVPTTIGFSASSTPPGNILSSNSVVICPKPTVRVSKVSDAYYGGANGQFSINLISPLPAGCGNLSVGFSLGGTATSGGDYTAPGTSVIFSPGDASRIVNIVSTSGAIRNIDLTLTGSNNYRVATGTGTASMSLTTQGGSEAEAIPTLSAWSLLLLSLITLGLARLSVRRTGKH